MTNKDIINKISLILRDDACLCVEDDGLITYLIKKCDGYDVAIPYSNEEDINQDFVGMKIFSTNILYDNNQFRVLCLHASDEVDFNSFSLIASDFISADNRTILLNHPYEWVDAWINILGNAIQKKTVYDVLGELIALKHCYENDKTLEWIGRQGGTHDIVGETFNIEVKSSTLKKETKITINSAIQLHSEKQLFLYYVRLEKKPYCAFTINNIVKDLVRLGYQKSTLEKSLEEAGYPQGDRRRDISYDLLELNKYPINENTFPIISLASLNNFAPKNNIIDYTITIDLLNIDHETLFAK